MPRFAKVSLAALLVSAALFAAAGSPVYAACTGDCDDSGGVTIDEIVRLVNVALGQDSLGSCINGDSDGNTTVTIEELVTAVRRSLDGCPAEPSPTPTVAPCAQRNPQRNLYFGDLHVHTTNSFDAHIWDTRATPLDALHFARGEALLLPPLDAAGQGTRRVQLERPLDFTAITDHSEFLGEIDLCTTPGSAAYDAPTCAQFRAGGDLIFSDFGVRLTAGRPRRFSDICGSDGEQCRAAMGPVWQAVRDAAGGANERCNFTAFVAFEYSRSPGASTMHRNVIFRSDQVPLPVSAFEQPTPQGLWAQLKTTCQDALPGCDWLAIPHNSNESNGRMFLVEYPGAMGLDEQRRQAATRAAAEPLMEIYQHKGNSECLNGLSGLLGSDEQCNFEIRRALPYEDCGDGAGQLGAAGLGCVSRLDYSRGALLAGVREQIRLGVNPYQLGFVASTDTHNATPGLVDEWAWVGHQGSQDGSTAALLGTGSFVADGVRVSPGGLAAIWAEENTRESLFDALRRRETFATSGTRLGVRAFGGWNFSAAACGDPNLVQIGYDNGVPMGGVLPQRPENGAPSFLITASRDPGTTAHPGAKLARLQVIKGWIDLTGAANQRVYDVAAAATPGEVSATTCEPSGGGNDSFCEVWNDPDFDPRQHAFYTVRVIENPSCRWNTWRCNELPEAERPASCTDASVPKTIQERAWTSPIWYTPD